MANPVAVAARSVWQIVMVRGLVKACAANVYATVAGGAVMAANFGGS